jgi:hypothetical protein
MNLGAQTLMKKYGDFYASLSEGRGEIQQQVDRYFKNHIKLEERVFQSLEFMPEDNSSRISALWKNTLLFYPALACIIQTLLDGNGGYEQFANTLAELKTRKFSNVEIKKNYYGRLFRTLYRHPWYNGAWGDKAREVKKIGKITLIDLLLASLERGIANKEANPVVYNTYQSNKTNNDDTMYFNPAFEVAKNFQQQAVDSFNSIRNLDYSLGEQQFVIYHDEKKFRILPFATWSGSNYVIKGNNLIHTQRENVIQPNSPFGFESLEQLEKLINSNVKESEFQNFFTKYPEYLTTLGNYSKIHSQLILHEDDGKTKIPDFFLERFDNLFCDICELKKPNDVLTKEIYNLRTFKDRVHIALQQVSNYRNFFDDKANREHFFKVYGLKAFKPRVILIIGRTNNFYDDIERIKLEDRLFSENIRLYTYDDIVSNANRWLKYASR